MFRNFINHIFMVSSAHTLELSQEQYLEEGVKWDSVEVEFNESLINCFHQVLALNAAG